MSWLGRFLEFFGWHGPYTPRPRPPLPPTDGGLTLPAGVIRVTDERDGELVPRMYSYWSSGFIRPDGSVIVFVGHADGSPRFFMVGAGGDVARLGSMVSYRGTAEGWYWDREGWIYLTEGCRLRRVNPFTGEDRIVFDYGDESYQLWQAHSADDGTVHSATVRRIVDNGPYPNIGTLLMGGRLTTYFPAQGDLDESQITADGRYLVIKENSDNRIVTVATGEERTLSDADGAVGHSDVGASFVVGEDNIHGACVRWDLDKPLTPENRRTLFSTWNLGHLCVRGNRCLLSDATHISLVDLEGAGVTPLVEHGMVGSDYDHQVQANLDPTGRVAVWISNAAGRFDVYVTRID